MLSIDPVVHAQKLAGLGVGELFINNVDNDGLMQGYDLNIVRQITDAVNIPVIACGGANGIDDLRKVLHEANASAAAAGSMFIYHGKHRAVLITYPDQASLRGLALNKSSK